MMNHAIYSTVLMNNNLYCKLSNKYFSHSYEEVIGKTIQHLKKPTYQSATENLQYFLISLQNDVRKG